MTKDLIKDYFGISDTEFEMIWRNASKIVEKIMSETENGDDTNSYYNSVHEKYKDNKLVEKREKEFVNGKCIKNKAFNAKKGLTNKDSKTVNKVKDADAIDYSAIMKENESYRNQINDMTHYIDGLNDKIKQLEMDKAELQSIINNVKKCF